ncbi:MAG: ATP-binding cassette domain-containing protein [Halieaceae bacterium]|nr:ATP-binding cassette domain-containing protein [Halieaceae bacterium]
MSLCVSGITIHRNGNTLLSDASLAVVPGEVLVVLGPNGAGKSTLLRALAGDIRPSVGSATLNGGCLSAISVSEQAEHRAVVSEAATMAFDYTVRDVVELGWPERLVDRSWITQALAEVLAQSNTASLAGRIFNTLSSGEQQRVMYARGLLQVWRPPGSDSVRYLLLDEPTSNLDVKCSIALMESVRRGAASGLGVVAVLHDLNLAARFADRILLLNRGHVAGEGVTANVMTADLLSHVYETDILVEHHHRLNRLIILI